MVRPNTPGLDDLVGVIRTSGILELLRLAAEWHRLKEPDRAEAQDTRLSLQANYQHDGTPHILFMDRIYVHTGAGDDMLWVTLTRHPVDKSTAVEAASDAARELAGYFPGSFYYPDGMVAIPLTEL